ncbi:hypothetical protein D9M68_348350 [compost metagenome]
MTTQSHSDFPCRTPHGGFIRRNLLWLAIAAAAAGVMPLASAADLPQVQSVVPGSISISPDGKSMEVMTNQRRATIDWKSFSIGPDNTVRFTQPDGTSVVLNRVTGTDPSKIYGMLTSNGKLILLNPNGIWFGPDSKVSTAALTAAAGRITDEQLQEFRDTGKLHLQLSGKVRNEGRINVEDHGLVALLGAQVENAGVIQARKGQVHLATGPKATLDFHGDGLISVAVDGTPGEKESVDPNVKGGVHNDGQIDVGNGVVAMSAQRAARHLESVVSVGGSVVADSVSEQGGAIVLGNAEHTRVSGTLSAKGSEGGSIKVLGDDVSVAGSAKLDASGTRGKGGRVLVGGNFQGKGSEQQAKTTTVGKGAQLKADGKTDGGTVVAWSTGQTRFAGNASAKGGEKGGVVETSGRQLQVTADARVDTSGGKTGGTWLLDPDTISVVDTTTNAGLDTNGNATGSGNAWTISNQAIAEGLKTGNVQLLASNRINIDAPIVAALVGKDGSSNKPYTLALIANGTVAPFSSYVEGMDPTSDSGSVHITAPILLRDGNLFISATGDIRLIDGAPGDTSASAWNRRAIIDLGKGIAWLKTSGSASVLQDANTAVIADQTAAWGGGVKLDSALNSTRVIAGRATNGKFRFSQTNASGTVDQTSTVQSPYNAESLGEVRARQMVYLGSQQIVADSAAGPGSPYSTFNLSYNGEEFDAVLFEASRYVRPDGKGGWMPISQEDMLNYLDSSDYLVHGLSFTDKAGNQWKLEPDGSRDGLTRITLNGQVQNSVPTGFLINANGGTLAVSDFAGNLNDGWGVIGWDIHGAQNDAEIQHNQATDHTQQVVFSLPGKTTGIEAVLGWLFVDQTGWFGTVDGQPAVGPLHETAIAHYFNSVTAADGVQISSDKATLAINANDKRRTYGEANPQLDHSAETLNSAAQAVRDVDKFVDGQLGRSDITAGPATTTATPTSDVGTYTIANNHSVGSDSHVSRRYDVSFGDATLTIDPAPLVVTVDNKAKQVGQQDPALTYQAQGWKFADDERAFTLDRDPGEAAGNYRIFEKDGTRLVSANYTVTFIDGNLRIDGPVAPDPTPDPNPGPNPDPGPNPNPGPIPDPGPNPNPGPIPDPGPTPGPIPAPQAWQAIPALTQGATSERCSPIESPQSVSASHTATPAIVRTYSVQLVCKPRAYGSPEEQLPDKTDLINYANGLLREGRFQLPDWNRSVIPRDLGKKTEGGK